MARELRVDWIRCDGYGLCGDLAPDVIALDEWRYPIILAGSIPDVLRSDVQRAIDCCPMRALSLVDPRDEWRHRRRAPVDGKGASFEKSPPDAPPPDPDLRV
jgi:ferredoxin